MTTRTADCIIIGGGITGVSTAFQLAGLGLKRVLVLEKKFVGAGGTGRSVGIIRQLYPTRETSEMVLRSLAVFERFGDAEFLFDPARGVAEKSFDVLGEARVAEPGVRAGAKCAHEPLCLVRIEACSLVGEPE